MSISIKIIQRTDKLNRDNTAPIHLRLTQKGKSRYLSTGVTLPLEAWNAETQQINPDYPSAGELQFQVDSPIYKTICDFCESKGVAAPMWNKAAMSVILARYNTVGSPPNHEINIAYQLDERCTRLPRKVTLAYFVKALGMEEQYKAVMAGKFVKTKNNFSFSL